MIETRSPGKLYIAGEYAVVEPGHAAVLIAVDRFITVRLEPTQRHVELETSPHVRAAIEVIERLRVERGLERRYFGLEIASELVDDTGRKFGLGSSAAVVVAMIAALDRLYDLRLTEFERFQLALIATLELSPRASGGDLAAATYWGWIRYVAPDRAAIAELAATHPLTEALASSLWDVCEIRRLPAPEHLRVLVGWTGSPAATDSLVAGVSAHRPQRQAGFANFLTASNTIVDRLVTALETDDQPGAFRAIDEARALLHRLASATGIEIETAQLTALCEIAKRHHAAGKPSGAGGGDCGIVLAGPDSGVAAILEEWRARGIKPLDVRVQPSEGVRDER